MTSFSVNERHLDVDLGELGLAVGAQVLVAEAASDLVVALDAAHHEHLLELLRALRQRVELARVGARRNQVVASAFGRGVRQDRRFDLKEAALVEGLAHSLSHGMAKLADSCTSRDGEGPCSATSCAWFRRSRCHPR